MKRTICAILAAATLTMGLIGCQKEAKKDGYTPVESETCDFTISKPDSWEVGNTDGMIAIYNPKDISKANVTAFSFYLDSKEEVTSVEYWETYKKLFSDTYGNLSGEKVKEEDFKGQKIAHAYYHIKIGEEDFKCETALLVYGGKVYVFTLTQGAKTEANAENYNDHSDEFAEILKTFTPK